MWKDVNFLPNADDLTKEDLLQFQIALNRRLSHVLSHIKSNQIINLEANKITTNQAFITAAQIENLIVGGNVTMGPDAFISWENVTEKPVIPGEYTDAEAIAAIQGTYIDGENVWTINVYAQNIIAGFLKLVEGMKIGTEDESVSIDKDGIKITGGKISIKSENAETLIDEFGMNPKFLDYSKNLIWNSSFEVFDADLKPLFWFIQGTGICSQDSTFYSDRSLKLEPNALARQTWAARTKPLWIDGKEVRVSMYVNFVQDIEVRVVDIGTWQETGGTVVRYYGLCDGTLPKPDPLPTTLTFSGSAGWEDSRITFSFDSSEYGLDSTVAFALEIKNVGTGDVYIDGVMAHVDFTGQWAQLYKDGPRSTSVQSVGNYFTNPDVLEGNEAIFLDGVPLTELKLYDDGMILTFLDGTVTEYDFALDGDGNITSLTNGTTGIVTVIDDVGGAKP